MQMKNWIECPVEPRHLYLAWQASDYLQDRFRWAVGALQPERTILRLRYFRDPEFGYYNQGRSELEARKLGYKGYPGFSLKVDEHREGITEALMRRLPPRGRSDFSEYKVSFRIKSDQELSDLALLGHTQGHLPGDGFSVVDPLDATAENCDLLLEVAGFRYYADRLPFTVEVGQRVDIAPEPTNPKDPNAVQFRLQGEKIGNVNRLQAPTFLRWMTRSVRMEASVERVNGRSDRPKVFIFIRVRAPNDQLAAA